MDFEEKFQQSAQSAFLKFVESGSWILPNYDSRIKVSADWMEHCWKLVDSKKLQQQIASRIEEELANRIVNHLASEIATDIKQILSVKERKEAIRQIAREHLDEIMKAGS